MAAIITPEQASSMTGVVVTAEHIAAATGVVEALTGLDLSVDPLPLLKRDVRHLRNATAWQASYMKQHPDVLEREQSIASASVNGVSVTYRDDATGPGSLLAPLARMALRRLSWRGSKTVRMVPGRLPAETFRVPQTLTEDGSSADWKPLR